MKIKEQAARETHDVLSNIQSANDRDHWNTRPRVLRSPDKEITTRPLRRCDT